MPLIQVPPIGLRYPTIITNRASQSQQTPMGRVAKSLDHRHTLVTRSGYPRDAAKNWGSEATIPEVPPGAQPERVRLIDIELPEPESIVVWCEGLGISGAVQNATFFFFEWSIGGFKTQFQLPTNVVGFVRTFHAQTLRVSAFQNSNIATIGFARVGASLGVPQINDHTQSTNTYSDVITRRIFVPLYTQYVRIQSSDANFPVSIITEGGVTGAPVLPVNYPASHYADFVPITPGTGLIDFAAPAATTVNNAEVTFRGLY